MADNLPRIGSALLVRDEVNRILLGKRNKDPQRGSWVIPGGKIHAFESIADAAARELQEETGLIVEVGGHFNVYEIINPPNEHRIVIYSWGKVVGGEAKASDDISELKFFELDELGEVPVTPLVRRVLIDAGSVFSRNPHSAVPNSSLHEKGLESRAEDSSTFIRPEERVPPGEHRERRGL
jgi:8-oxo-dGTP diphosphatase